MANLVDSDSLTNLVGSDSLTNLVDRDPSKRDTESFCISSFCDRRAHRKYNPQVSALVSKIRKSDDPLIKSLRSANKAFKARKTEENLYCLARVLANVASKEVQDKDDCLVEKAEQLSHAILKGRISDSNRHLLEKYMHIQLLRN